MNTPGKTSSFSKIERMLAWRYLRARRKDGFISVIAGFSFAGIALGVATLIIVMAVMNGFRAELVSRVLGVNGHLIVAEYGRDIENYDEKIRLIKQIPGVTRAGAMIEAQLMLSAGDRTAGVMVRGQTAEDIQNTPLISKNIKKGDLASLIDGSAVAIGSKLAFKTGLDVGDSFSLISPRGRVTPFGTAPRIKSYKVGAIYEMGMTLYDDTFIFMDLKEAQDYFLKPGAVSFLDVNVVDPDKAASFSPAVVRALKGSAYVTSWQESNKTYFSALAVERNVMFLILSLIILVAALNIISGMIMLVKDKESDIAVLRTVGATQGAITRVFFMTGAAIGVTGTLTGFIVGVLFCANIEKVRQGISYILGVPLFDPDIYFLAKMPAEMTFTDTASVIVIALTLTFIATIYPARRAAKLDPAEALRYE